MEKVNVSVRSALSVAAAVWPRGCRAPPAGTRRRPKPGTGQKRGDASHACGSGWPSRRYGRAYRAWRRHRSDHTDRLDRTHVRCLEKPTRGSAIYGSSIAEPQSIDSPKTDRPRSHMLRGGVTTVLSSF